MIDSDAYIFHLLSNVYLCCHEVLVYKYTGCNELQELCRATSLFLMLSESVLL